MEWEILEELRLDSISSWTLDKHSPLRISCQTLRRWAWPATAEPPRWRRGHPPYWFGSPTPSVFWLVRGQTHACYNIDKNTRYVICGFLFKLSVLKIIYFQWQINNFQNYFENRLMNLNRKQNRIDRIRGNSCNNQEYGGYGHKN